MSSSSSAASSVATETSATAPPIATSTQERLVNIISSALSPTHLEVINESHMHSVPKGSETHFRVIVVSDKFQGMMPVQRHRTVYGLAKPEMRPDSANPSDPNYFHQIHALAIVAKTTSEWGLVSNDASLKKSPSCLGGEKKEREGKI
jgi:BolA protein